MPRFRPFTALDYTTYEPIALKGNQNDGFQVVRFSDGSSGIVKTLKEWTGNKTGRVYPAEILAVQEFLAARVGEIMDAPIRDCRFIGNTGRSVVMPWVEGLTGRERGEKELPLTADGLWLRVFDHLVANSDRRPKNWMVLDGDGDPPGGIVGIDHALCGFSRRGSGHPKAVELATLLVDQKASSLPILGLVGPLAGLRPTFAQFGYDEQHANMMHNLEWLITHMWATPRGFLKADFHGNQYVTVAGESHKVYWHGSPNGVAGLQHGRTGVHVGTYQQAKQALEARIGARADGKDWDGTQEYGKTPLASSGAGIGAHVPAGGHLASGGAVYADGTPIPLDAKPSLFPVAITGKMSNTPDHPMGDWQANGRMASLLERGRARSGYYYENVGEGGHAEGDRWVNDISAVVPGAGHLTLVDRRDLIAKGGPGSGPRPGDYRGRSAPSPDENAPMHDLTGGGNIFPPDVYDQKNQMRLYGHEPGAQESFNVINQVHDNPDAMVTVYRGVPSNVDRINPGDWVTPSPTYAAQHVQSNVPDGHVVSQTARAGDLWTDGNSVNEWGWHPAEDPVEKGGPGSGPREGDPHPHVGRISDARFGEVAKMWTNSYRYSPSIAPDSPTGAFEREMGLRLNGMSYATGASYWHPDYEQADNPEPPGPAADLLKANAIKDADDFIRGVQERAVPSTTPLVRGISDNKGLAKQFEVGKTVSLPLAAWAQGTKPSRSFSYEAREALILHAPAGTVATDLRDFATGTYAHEREMVTGGDFTVERVVPNGRGGSDVYLAQRTFIAKGGPGSGPRVGQPHPHRGRPGARKQPEPKPAPTAPEPERLTPPDYKTTTFDRKGIPKLTSPIPQGWKQSAKLSDSTKTVWVSKAGNTAVFPKGIRGWKPGERLTNAALAAIDAHSTGKTLDFGSGTRTSTRLAEVTSTRPNDINFGSHLTNASMVYRLAGFTKQQLMLHDAHQIMDSGGAPHGFNLTEGGKALLDSMHAEHTDRSLTALGNAHNAGYMFKSPEKQIECTVLHELGHSDFFAKGQSMDGVKEAINRLYKDPDGYHKFPGDAQHGASHMDRSVDWEREARSAHADWMGTDLNKYKYSERMYNYQGGQIKGSDYYKQEMERRESVWQNSARDMADSGKLGDHAQHVLEDLGVTKYGRTTLHELVAEAHAAYTMPELPKSPLTLAIADTLGWNQVQKSGTVGSMTHDVTPVKSPELVRPSEPLAIVHIETPDGPAVQIGDRVQNLVTGEWTDEMDDLITKATGSDFIALAMAVAAHSHEGQLDKQGKPYIGHPARVARNIAEAGGGENEIAAAWLHDTVEDTSVTLDYLRELGFPDEIVDIVDLMTHEPNVPNIDYWVRLRTNPSAVLVKLADIRDNTDPSRHVGLDPHDSERLLAKYSRATAFLTAE